LTFKNDLDRYLVCWFTSTLSQRSFRPEVICRHTDAHTHTHILWINCSTGTTKGSVAHCLKNAKINEVKDLTLIFVINIFGSL